MYNDLIFPILPRNTKIPVEGDNRIQQIRKAIKSESLNQDEKEQHDQTHKVDEAARQERHRRAEGVYKEPKKDKDAMSEEKRAQPPQSDAGKKQQNVPEETDNGDTTRTAKTPAGRKHLDVFI